MKFVGNTSWPDSGCPDFRLVEGAFDEVTSAIDIFVKDMGLVVDAARESRFAAPLAHATFLSFLAASGKGWGALDDSAVMRNYDTGSQTDD